MSLAQRLHKLTRLWPPAPCPECAARPPIFCIAHADDSVPDFPAGPCPTCGMQRTTVLIVVGVSCDAI
jgi:hypothetical protein